MMRHYKNITKLLVFLSPSFLTTKAFALADDAYPIYALSDANTLYGIINGIAALMNNQMFKSLLVCFGLLGLAWIILLTALQRNYIRVPIYIIGSAIFIQFALAYKVNVQVIDQLTAETYVVQNVPGILAIPASYLSVLGFEGAKIIDAAYAPVAGMPSSMTLTGGAPFSITNQLISDATNYQIKDPYLNSSMIHFIVDCGVPAIENGKLKMSQLLTSNNIWALFTANNLNPSLMTINYGFEAEPQVHGLVMTCPDSYQEINKALPKASENMIKHLSKNFMAGITATLFEETLQYNAKNDLYNPSAGTYLQQAAILNLLKGPVQSYMASKSQNSALMQSLSVSQAVEATEMSWVTSAQVFAKTMGYIYSALQVLIFAVAPILILFAIFPGAGKIIGKRYLTLLAWFPMTFIMLAICNDLILSWSHNELSNIFTNYGGLVRGSQSLITAKAVKMQTVGAFLVAVTPIISFAIIAGLQVPITNILSHSGALTYGQQAGQVAASGNMSLDNESYHNVSANKFNSTSTMDVGATPVEHNVAGANSLLKANFGGQSVLLNGAPDMMAHQTQTNVQSSHGGGETITTDSGGNISSDHGMQSSATVGHSAQNTRSTAIEGNVNFGRTTQNTAKAMEAAATAAGVAVSANEMNAMAAMISKGKLLSDEAQKAQIAGDMNAKSYYQNEAKNLFGQTFEQMKNAAGPSWKDNAALAAIVGVGVTAAFATGVGEAAVGGALLAGAGSALASSKIGGEALKSAAIEKNVVNEVESSLVKIGANKGFKNVAKDILKGFVGFNIAATETEKGSYETHEGADYGSKNAKTGQEKEGYQISHKIDDHTNLTKSTTESNSYLTPNDDLNKVLNVINPHHESSAIHKAKVHYRKNRHDIKHASKETQAKIEALKSQSNFWEKETNEELKERGHKINQLSSSKKQKEVGEHHVD